MLRKKIKTNKPKKLKLNINWDDPRKSVFSEKEIVELNNVSKEKVTIGSKIEEDNTKSLNKEKVQIDWNVIKKRVEDQNSDINVYYDTKEFFRHITSFDDFFISILASLSLIMLLVNDFSKPVVLGLLGILLFMSFIRAVNYFTEAKTLGFLVSLFRE